MHTHSDFDNALIGKSFLFKFINSWGAAGWGEDGYGYLPYDYPGVEFWAFSGVVAVQPASVQSAARPRISVNSPGRQMIVTLPNGREVELVVGDLTTFGADVIVNSIDEFASGSHRLALGDAKGLG